MIAPMSRVEVVCLSSVRQALVVSLQEQGLLHLEEVPLELEEAPDFLGRVQLEGAAQEAFSQLEELERLLAEVAPLLSVTPSATNVRAAMAMVAGWDDAALSGKLRDWSSKLREVTRRRVSLQDSLDVLSNYRTILEQVAPVLGGSEVKLGKGTRALVLTGDVKRVVARLEERFGEEIGPELKFHKNQVKSKQLVGLLSFPESKGEVVSRILNQEGVTPVDMRDESFQNATVGEVIGRIDSTMAGRRTELGTLEGETNKPRGQLCTELWAAKVIVADRLAQFRVHGQFAQSEMVTVIHGWTPSDQYDTLEQAIERDFAGKAEVNRISHEGIDHVAIPTQLRNPALFKPFEVVLSIFKPPTYGTIDPTKMVAVAFIFFYGFILGDVFYGISVILLAKWLGRKWGHIAAVQSASAIGVYMGISAIVFGVIYGEYFGNLVEKVVWPALFGHELHPLFHRAHATTELLLIAIIFGLIHIPLALIIGIRESFRHGHTTHAIEKIGLLMGLTALVIMTCNYFGVPILSLDAFVYLAAALFVVGAVLIFKAMGMMGLIGILEIMSLGGNVLSYARLMALGIASIALADIANMLPGMFGYWLGIPAALLVHMFNLGIGVASPTIHSLRLNFVEFLPEFYSPDGKDVGPFRTVTQA